MGIYKFGILKERSQIRKRNKPPTRSTSGGAKNILIDKLKKYLVEDRHFQDPDLSLEKTAEFLDVSQGHLSKMINQELQMSFKDYVNRLRVEEAKRLIASGELVKKTLLGIGLTAGFSSKTTFNRAFKKHTGQTPGEFARLHR